MSQPPYLPEKYLSDQLVVALLHERLIGDAINRVAPDVRITDSEPDPLLGLTRLTLESRGLQAFGAANPGERQIAGNGDDRFALDSLLQALNTSFEKEYSGWVPALGKNRVVTRVAHNIDGGGEGPPTAVAAKQERRPTGRPDVPVGIADTAIWPHPWFNGRCIAMDDLLDLDRDAVPEYTAGHGTFVAGAVLREAPSARLFSFTCLDADGQTDSWDVARQLVRVRDSGVCVLNMSFGCLTEDNKAPLVLTTAIDRLDADIVLVAAAGNHGASEVVEDRARPLYPAALDDVVAVGATDRRQKDPAVDWSPDPAACPWIDALAWGTNVTSTFLPKPVRLSHRQQAGPADGPDQFAVWSGTSFAAARMSGAIARTVSEEGLPARDAAKALLDGLPTVSGLPWLGPDSR